jgi:Tfp pilus assembly protein PilO
VEDKNWNRVVQVFRAIIIILALVVFGILGYWQIQLNKNSKRLDELKVKIEELNRDYEKVRATYINEIENSEVQ